MTNDTSTKQTIAYLGLGAMGVRMAQRLLDAGHAVTVYNRTAAAADALVGAQRAATPREAVDGADVVISCLRDDDASRAVWLDGDHGAKAGLKPGALGIESSTLTPAFTKELAAALDGVAFVEAPVLGSRPQAEAGQLVHLVGGDSAAFERAQPVLAAMGKAAFHLGPVGAAAAMKLAVNTLFAAQVAALGEALGFLAKSGLEVPAALDLLGKLPTTSPAVAGVGKLLAARQFAPLFPVELVAKDLAYTVKAAEAVDATVPSIRAVAEVYRAATDEGLGHENLHAVAKRYA